MFWTFQPKREQSEKKHIPFNTWEVQDEIIVEMVKHIRYGGDMLVDKSREMGATWIVLGCFFYEWLFAPDTTLLCISRKQESVDKKGNPDSLFWKLDYLCKNLPIWAMPPVEQGKHRTHMHLLNPWNNSVIDGESTNADVGAGGRRQAVMCDEFARVDPSEAANIEETLSDTTPCRIFNSTPTSRGHPFGKIRFGGKVEIFEMPWYRHPWKMRGLYKTPDINKIQIYDLQYYRLVWPEIFCKYKPEEIITYSDFENLMAVTTTRQAKKNIRFIADGNQGEVVPLNGWRSPWYDKETIDRGRSPRDIACNINMDYVGSGDTVFNPRNISRMIEAYCCKPRHEGEIVFTMSEDNISAVRFATDYGRRRFKWWGELAGSRPPQNHNFIIGCDISLGTGASNSVASVYDVDTDEKIGVWVCSDTSPTNFAEQVYAIGKWVGGCTGMPFLIWEANGPGQTFDRRLEQVGYDFVYNTREEKTVSRKKKKTRGWYSSSDSKLTLLSEYDAAMACTFSLNSNNRKFINHDKRSMREAEDYIFYQGMRCEVGLSSKQDEEGSARAAHGDMVIADALCNLARFDQPRAATMEASFVNEMTGSYADRMYNARKLKSKEQEDSKWLL